MRKPVIKILLFSLIFLAAAAAFALHGAGVMGDNRKNNAEEARMAMADDPTYAGSLIPRELGAVSGRPV